MKLPPNPMRIVFSPLRIATLAVLLAITANVRLAAAPFEKLEGCRLLQNIANDGDSFHVSCKGAEYIFRLYFVDAPETENEYPARVQAQAKYFGLTTERTIQIGRIAAAFTRGKLTGRSFTVHTRWEDAKGQSRLPRYYGLVVVDSQDISGLLIANGLARIYGMHTLLPDGTSPRTYLAQLRLLENKAKHDHLGAWSAQGRKAVKTEDAWELFFRK